MIIPQRIVIKSLIEKSIQEEPTRVVHRFTPNKWCYPSDPFLSLSGKAEKLPDIKTNERYLNILTKIHSQESDVVKKEEGKEGQKELQNQVV